MERQRWIVVGVDFSDGARRALEYALEHAPKIGARVAAVHVYEDRAGTPAFHDPVPALREQLHELVELCGCYGTEVELMVRRGAPWEKILNVAGELGAELIVVGAEGQRCCSKERFLGSCTTRVATASNRSVVVVPSGRVGVG